MTGLTFSYYISIGFMSVLLEKYVNIERQEVANIITVTIIFSLVGHLLTGFISQYIGRLKILTIFGIVSILSSLSLLLG